MTIQKEQDDIIREDRQKVVVVNGVAGSGKTTIALHRVAYLLYNYRQQLGDKVLILGPNDVFIDYIAEVLPNLGESDVAQETFASFAIKEIGLNEEVIDFTAYLEEVLKGNEEIINEIKHKASEEFIEFLDKKCAEFEESYFTLQPVTAFGEEIVSLNFILSCLSNVISKSFASSKNTPLLIFAYSFNKFQLVFLLFCFSCFSFLGLVVSPWYLILSRYNSFCELAIISAFEKESIP